MNKPKPNGQKNPKTTKNKRLDELACVNAVSGIIDEKKSIEETLQQITVVLPRYWQYPDYTCCRINYNDTEFVSPGFRQTKWCLREQYSGIENQNGFIEVYYTAQFINQDSDSPFPEVEKEMLAKVTELITGYINTWSAREKQIKPPEKYLASDAGPEKFAADEKENRRLLQRFLNKNNYARDIYHDLMPFKVKEILLIANLYDAYNIEREGRFSEHVLGEYSQLNLTSVPRITGVSNERDAFAQLESRHFDLVIVMTGAEKKLPLILSQKIKNVYPYIPIHLLVNSNKDVSYFKNLNPAGIDRLFAWNGDSNIFFAMIKHVEDRINARNDTRVGLTRVILLVEDSPKYYTRYLPMLYHIIMKQTRRIIDDVSTDELYKVLRLRARPKILMATNYEDAIKIFRRYREYLLCLITDVRFPKDGILDEYAGIGLIRYVKSEMKDLPVIMQSSDVKNASLAKEMSVTFIDKNSESLSKDIKSFITNYLGFGDFIFRDEKGKKLGVARNLREFERMIETIPDNSLLFHGKKNHFSMWLMARGEIQVAKIINPAHYSDFETPGEMRKYLLEKLYYFRNEQNKGKVVPFEESSIIDEINVVSLSEGALGGKGRGLAFINSLLFNYDFSRLLPDMIIRNPVTTIIGTEEFETFLEDNNLYDKIYNGKDYKKIKSIFLRSRLSESLAKKLEAVVKNLKKPLAVRSSGLFEDSLNQPFSGIFSTYLLPNNHPDWRVRFRQCMNAVKLVYASIYSDLSRSYIHAIDYKIEEERMAVVIQEVVGHEYDGTFYPHLSGVAQSFNYYPFGHMKPEDGFAVLAVGLGQYVVEGEKAFRFCPKYPNLEINSPRDQFKNSQVYFYAVDLSKKNLNLMEGEEAGLIKLPISEAEKHGTLKHLVSVYNPESDQITPGIDAAGPRIVNFANILKYDYIPLARAIEVVTEVVSEAMGCPVEIEFAVDLNKDKDNRASLYLLQIKPLIGGARDFEVNMDEIDMDKTILLTSQGMGNGLVNHISDVVFIEESNFDKSLTEEMAVEINRINEQMIQAGRQYILIGPGRWGTRDKWIGIPVKWPQISNAKVIVETNFEDYPLDASSGSHFFHNVTTMNVGYFSVYQENQDQFIKWDILKKQKLVSQGKYFTHVRFDHNLKILMDGKKGISLIMTGEE